MSKPTARNAVDKTAKMLTCAGSTWLSLLMRNNNLGINGGFETDYMKAAILSHMVNKNDKVTENYPQKSNGDRKEK